MTTTISNKGWVVIPADLRRKYHLHPGQGVQIVDYGGVLALVPSLQDPIREAAGMLSKGDRSLTAALMEERRRELDRE